MERSSCDVKGADLGSGRGPCAVHDSFRVEVGLVRESALAAPAEGGASSRYADPEAEGVRPVLRTVNVLLVSSQSCCGPGRAYISS